MVFAKFLFVLAFAYFADARPDVSHILQPQDFLQTTPLLSSRHGISEYDVQQQVISDPESRASSSDITNGASIDPELLKRVIYALTQNEKNSGNIRLDDPVVGTPSIELKVPSTEELLRLSQSASGSSQTAMRPDKNYLPADDGYKY